MSDVTSKYILDANVFIEAYRRYYSFDIAPSFWEFLVREAKAGKVISIDRVFDELKKGKDDLAKWAEENFSFAFINTKDDSDVVFNYGRLMIWANEQTQYSINAIEDFAIVENADAWIIATAMARGYVIVTHEVLDRTIKKKIPIPNVCEDFGVRYIDTFVLLRELNFQFK
jgi:predicted nucleic acid-binding protein